MDSLLYSLNVVTPIFLLVIVGYALRHMNIMSGNFAEEGAKMTFKLALPLSTFRSICNSRDVPYPLPDCPADYQKPPPGCNCCSGDFPKQFLNFRRAYG